MPTTLRSLAGYARLAGWTPGSGSISQVQRDARSLGWTEVPIRGDSPSVTTLRPVSRSEARPNSLSARYGMDAQPLHTDGAHLVRPPDVVVLVCETTSSVPTRLWRLWGRVATSRYVLPEYIRHGVFLVDGGRDSFFATACPDTRLRYDPECMTPCDARARQAAAHFEEGAEDAVDHVWDKPNMVLVIDNRTALHGRASAVREPQRKVHRISFYTNDETQ
jgi:hypothetical protein